MLDGKVDAERAGGLFDGINEEPDNSRVKGGGWIKVDFPCPVVFEGESNGYGADVEAGVNESWKVAESEDSGAGTVEVVDEASEEGNI